MSRNMSCVHNDNQESLQYFASLQAKSTPYFVPALLLMSLSIAVGSVGNCLVLIVYSTKLARTALRTFIICMSVFDLLISIFVIPDEMYDLLHMWDFQNPLVCRFRKFFKCSLVMGSFLVLVAIAVTRYKMVCCPSEKRVTITQAKVFSVIIALVCIILAIPYFVINGGQKITTPNPKICAYFCQVDESFIKTIWPTVNSLLFIASYVTCTIAVIVSYFCIGHKVWKQKVAWNKSTRLRQHKHHPVSSWKLFSKNTSSIPENNRVMSTTGPDLPSPLNQSSQQDNQSASSCAEVEYSMKSKGKLRICFKRCKSRANSRHQKSMVKLEEDAAKNIIRGGYTTAKEPKQNYLEYFLKSNNEQSRNDLSGSLTILTTMSTAQLINTPDVKQESFMSNTITKRRSMFSKTSWMMAMVSFVSIVGFVPFLSLHLYKTVAPESHASLEGLPFALFHVFFRSYLLNSAINPIMFSVWDNKFRRECIKFINSCQKK